MKIPRYITVLFVFMSVVIALSGCQIGGKTRNNETGTLVVLDQNESLFKSHYLPHITNAYPELEVKLVPYEAYMSEQMSKVGMGAREEALHELLEQYNPDIIIARDDETYRQLIEGNRLKVLDGLIQEGKLELDLAATELLDPIKDNDGLKYALASHFSGSVLYYNKNVFEKVGVPLPTEGMTWEQVYQLAAQIPAKDEGEDSVYGFANAIASSPYFSILGIGASEGLSYLDEASEKVTVNTPEWRRIWEMVLVPLREGHIFSTRQGESNGNPMALFKEGKIAMMYANETILSQLINDNLPWDTVAAPINPRYSDQGNGLHYLAYFGIHTKGGRTELAWEIIKQLNGEEIAGANWGQGIPLRKKLADQQFKGTDLTPFYRLAAYPASSGAKLPKKITSDFLMNFLMEGERKAIAVISSELTIDQALKQLEEMGQLLLEQDRAKVK
ncbi:multiple sugar transport system substrate-binding protein [Paenibacillus endophyticus]|uniref:Multiple sugar transport system substrate-binding protein n=1 Tax=Paenibacillus endophyticus TaxID=1294268 RepID=A0A7W5CC26_9BACL|nr:extracellular solute-binding protein [Paenibacillus endophyticus]MBB3154054.1 multiple sugar transport system substrate-binding protein [Paenibacillus endophyticus]